MPDPSGAALEFQELARALREAGETGLRRELYQAVNEAAKPFAATVRSVEHLRPYMPDRYAEILAEDLAVTILKRTGTAPGVSLRAKGRRRSRHVARLNEGILTHPVFGTEEQEARAVMAGLGHGRGWTWVSQDIRPRFFDDPAQDLGPEARRQIEAAVQRITDRIYRFTRGR